MVDVAVEFRLGTPADTTALRNLLAADPSGAKAIFIDDALAGLSKDRIIVGVVSSTGELISMLQLYVLSDVEHINARLKQLTLDLTPHLREKLKVNFLTARKNVINEVDVEGDAADAVDYIYNPKTDVVLYIGSYYLAEKHRGKVASKFFINSWLINVYPYVRKQWTGVDGSKQRLVMITGSELKNYRVPRSYTNYVSRAFAAIQRVPFLDIDCKHVSYVHPRPDTREPSAANVLIFKLKELIVQAANPKANL